MKKHIGAEQEEKANCFAFDPATRAERYAEGTVRLRVRKLNINHGNYA